MSRSRPRSRFALLAVALLAGGVPAAQAAEDRAAASLAFTGIRPGIGLSRTVAVDDAPRCTANFVYQETDGPFDPTEDLYLGTAGHCFSMGELIYGLMLVPNTGAAVKIPIGTVVLDVDAGADFALIAIDGALNDWVSPSVAYVGGPTAAYTGPGTVPGWLVGHGTIVGTGGTARPGLIQAYDGTEFHMAVPGAGGDSGAPILTATGEAAGHVRFAGRLGPPFVGTDTLAKSVQQADAVTDKHLATCPSAVPWPLPGCPPV